MKKKRILSGVQPSGLLHIGNYFGMIKRMIEFQKSSDLFCFIINLKSRKTRQPVSFILITKHQCGD